MKLLKSISTVILFLGVLVPAVASFAGTHIPSTVGESNPELETAQKELDELGCRELYNDKIYPPSSSGARLFSSRVFLDFSSNDYGYNHLTGTSVSLRFRKATEGAYDIEVVRVPGPGFLVMNGAIFQTGKAPAKKPEQTILFVQNVPLKDNDIVIRWGLKKRVRIQCGKSLYVDGQPKLVIR